MPSSTSQHFHHHALQSPTYLDQHKMSPPQRTSSSDSTDGGLRKRVCKACDRCRLKKSKCDGSSPCSRCKADNAICVFGERKKAHDKVYPKGYVEMLEQQQNQLVEGLQEMYRRLLSANAWTAPALSESNGHPLTHDILAALDLLETKHDGSGEAEAFEEDCSKLQTKLLAEGAGYVQRRGSFSSDSDHSHHSGHSTHSRNNSQSHKTTTAFQQTPPSSLPQSPRIKQSPSQHLSKLQILQQHAQQQSSVRQSSPLRHDSPITNDVPVFQAPWASQRPFDLQQPPAPLRMADNNGLPDLDNSMFDGSQFEEAMAFDGYNSMMMTTNSIPMPLQYGNCDFGFDPMEFELNKFVAVQ